MARIMVVDDEPQIVNLLDKFLTKKGHEVIKCYGGQEAMNLIHKKEAADLIILDHRMPVVDGSEVLKEARKVYGDMPVLMLSGSVGGRSKDLEINGFLAKPISLDQLLKKIQEILK